ncbi:hypothetical protein [Bacterioplanoides sp.]|uniref:hypothetical protein n=1 Tax=Bacterioplanoides sp. TaxID=2066072 RepID=UPI003B59FCAE
MVKKTLLSLAIAATAAGMAGCQISSVEGNNKVDQTAVQAGDPTLGGKAADTVSPIFSPATSQLPLANDLIYAANSGTGVVAGVTPGADGTADIANPESNPVKTAINDLDGFSTIAPIDIPLNGLLESDLSANGKVLLIPLRNASNEPSVGTTPVDPLNIRTIVDVAGLQAAVAAGNTAAAAGIIRKSLNPGMFNSQGNPDSSLPGFPQFDLSQVILKTPTGQSVPHLRIMPKKPLLPKTKYVVALTNELRDSSGQPLTEPTEYTSLTGDGSLFSPRLSAVRDLVKLTENIAGGFYSLSKPGGNAGDIILSYAFTTGGTTDVLKAMAAPETFIVGGSIAEAEAKVRAGVIATKADDETDAAVAARAEASLKQVAAGVAQAVSARPDVDIDHTADNVIALVKANAIAADAYKNALRGQITGKIAAALPGLNALVDSPKARTYTEIPGVAVPFTSLLTSQITPRVEAQITDIATGEGAITKSVVDGGGSAAAAAAQLDAIAGQVAVKINEAQAGTLPTTDGATVRPILKASEQLAPQYLAGLRTAIVTGQVNALTSGGSIRQGGLTMPNYLPDAVVGTADGALGMWRGSDAISKALRNGLDAPRDKDGTANVSYRFPFANKVGNSMLPVMATLPPASCDPDGAGPAPAIAKPADGWPVAIYQHGITVDRTAGLLVGNALAKQCIAMVAIDHVAHGVAPLDSAGVNSRALFNVEQVASETAEIAQKASPFAFAVNALVKANPDHALKDLKERHNNIAKGKAAADKAKPGIAMVFKYDDAGKLVEAESVGKSADLYINLQNFGRTRDHIRQTVVDLLNLNASIGSMDVDGDNSNDFNADKVFFIGHSLGGIVGTTFLAVNNDPDVQKYNTNLKPVKAAALGNPGGGIVKLLENSPGIGAQILAGLAGNGLKQGDASLETFFTVFQATIDSGDPINFTSTLEGMPVLVYEDVGGFKENADATPELSDQVVPNNALNPSQPSARSLLAGTDPLVTQLGITDKLTKPVADAVKVNNPGPNGTGILTSSDVLRQNVRISKGTHSTFSSADPQDVFAEEYMQIVTFFDAYNAGAEYKSLLVKDTNVLEVPAQ